MLDNYWERDGLYQYDWQEFEGLVGTLFKAEGYDVKVTQGTQDFGVDVYAEKGNSTIAIQVKQFSEGNRVGREPLQKLASTLAMGSADEVIVVTSSSFAKTAKDYARDFGSEMHLIDGSDLIDRLINAEVPPPS
jgi:restriction system protein